MKYVVTGGLGFIGSNIVRMLVKNNHNVIVIDNLNTGNKTRVSNFEDRIKFHKIDIRNKNDMKPLFENIDGVFHNAALTDVQESYKKEKEYCDVNVEGTRNVLELGRKNNIKIIFASSASVYGNTNTIPIKENFKQNAINPYGHTKIENELMAKKLSITGLRFIGLRYFNVFGIGQTNSYAGVITKFLRQLKEKKSPIIFGKGSQIRDFIHVEDVAKANIRAMNSDVENDFFNIGSGVGTSILELSKMMIKISKLQIEPIFKPEIKGDIEFSKSSIDHAKNKLNWNPEISLNEGLKEIINKN
jgi:UDP-glucose 4-epimerase